MRYLVLTRGAPGAGKSTFLRQQGLAPFTLSPDDFRLRLGGIAMTAEGDLGISHAHEKQVWREVEEALDFKMGQGQLVVMDATFQRGRDFTLPLQCAERHRYEVFCVDFTGVPQELALERNLEREVWKVVPENVITTAYERFAAHTVPKKITVWPHDAFAETPLLDRLEPPLRDLSSYEKVVHIGDLQGCYAPVEAFFADGFRDDHYYIFVGDLLDRGIQNGEVIRFAVEEIIPRPNVAFIWGNHEHHIHRFAKNLEQRSAEFVHNTLPQIEAARFTRTEANALMDKAEDVLAYVFRGQKVLVTHAGIAAIPERFAVLPSRTFWNGTGTYNHAVDRTFSEHPSAQDWLQVHGHRNAQELPIEAAPRSFNLEGQVEFGGHLRIMTLEGDGEGTRTTTGEIKNDVFRKEPAPVGASGRIEVGGRGEHGRLSRDLLGKLEAHPLVRAKSFASRPHIRSLNFTSKAFFDGKWDQVNGMARGLFVADDRRIVARSYPKFFNLGERPETRMKGLRQRLSFPLTMWIKENGFLGVLGWDHLGDDGRGELLFCSKSTPESEFAGWFRDIFLEQAGDAGAARAAELVKNRNLSLIFEVNDPDRDPHMIAYDRPHVVLLDAVLRQEEFAKLSYTDMSQVAAAIGVGVKQRGPTFKQWSDFEGWTKAIAAQGRYFQWKGDDIEGFVAEDADGFLFKIKLDFYSFWKRMRSQRDRVRRAREKGRPLPEMLEQDAEALDFHHWLLARPDEDLVKDIITLRETFWRDTGRAID